MSHYFTKNSNLVSNEKEIKYQFEGETLTFITDEGVFSKRAIDYGSQVLLKILINQELGQTLLDVGCGYGVLGLTLAKIHSFTYLEMVDINDRSVLLTQKNAILNGIDHVVVKESDTYSQVTSTFDTIISNPPIRAGKKIVHHILEAAYQHLNVGGRLFIVIQKKQGAPSALVKMEAVFGNVEVLKKDRGYYILASKKCLQTR